MVTLDRTTEEIGDCVIGKAMDDRLSVFIMIEALRALRSTNCDIYAVATTQEEVGLRGAITSAYAIDPDISIALDVTLAVDLPGMDEPSTITKLGAGTAIKLIDSSLDLAPEARPRLPRRSPNARRFPIRLEILPRGGTDAGAMQRARAGNAAITLSDAHPLRPHRQRDGPQARHPGRDRPPGPCPRTGAHLRHATLREAEPPRSPRSRQERQDEGRAGQRRGRGGRPRGRRALGRALA